MERVLLVRYSELAVKGPLTRRRMERLLVEAIQEALRREGVVYAGISVEPGRIIVRGPEDPERAAGRVARVFGVKSVSPAYAGKFETLKDIVHAGSDLFADRVKGRIFRVRARRTGTHDFTSKDVERELGALLLSAGARGVNLERPEYTVHVEVRGRRVYFYDTIIPGPGGLPLGSEEPVLVLYSGGFDSTVASWLMMRRGAPVGLMLYDLGVRESVEVALEVARVLARDWVYWGRLKLYIVDFASVLEAIRRAVTPDYRLLVLRRLMMEHACEYAQTHGYEALATGESIGQVASQTVRNMRLIGSNLCLPVLRPVSGMDKDEVMHLAMRIGVHDIVARHVEACRGRPVPRASPRVFGEMLSRAREAIGSGLREVSIRSLELP